MPRPIKLPIAKVIAAGRKAYLAGELSAQGPKPACAYVDTFGRPCIVGAAMTPTQRERLEDSGGGSVIALEDRRAIATDDLAALSDLQRAHDAWADRVRSDAARAAGHRALCALLGLPEPLGPITSKAV